MGSPLLTRPVNQGNGRSTLLRPTSGARPKLLQGRISGPRMPNQIDSLGLAEGIGRTFFHGLGPGLIGIEPSKELAQFQAKNPISSAVAELAGTLVPYSIPVLAPARFGIGLAARLPGLAKLVKTAEGLRQTGPVRSAALREISRFAPLEGTRVFAAAVAGGTDSAKDVGQEAVFNLALFGGVGAIGGALSGAVPLPRVKLPGEKEIAQRLREFNLLGSSHEKLAQIIEAPEANAAVFKGIESVVNAVRKGLEKDILTQQPKRGVQNLVTKLIGPKGKARAGKVSRFFGRLGVMDDVAIRKFSSGGKGRGLFESGDDLGRALEQSGLDLPNNLHDMQFLRHITTRSEAGRKKLLDTINDAGFSPIQVSGNNAWLAKEQDGIFAVVKRIKRRGRGQKAGDEYVFFKTRDAGRFFPNLIDSGTELLTRNAYKMREASRLVEVGDRTPIYNFFKRMEQAMPEGTDLRVVPVGARTEALARTMTKIMPRVAPEQGVRAAQEFKAGTKFLLTHMKRFLAPGTTRFSGDAQALRAWTLMQAVFARSQAITRQEFFGKEVLKPDSDFFKVVLGEGHREGSVMGLIQQAFRSKGGRAQANAVLDGELTIQQLVDQGMNREVIGLFQKLESLDLLKSEQILATQRAFESVEQFAPLRQHYMISRRWRGAWRTPIFVEGSSNRVVGYASGTSRRQALQSADDIIEQANAAEGGIRLGRFSDGDSRLFNKATKNEDLALAQQINLTDPGKLAFDNARRNAVVEPSRFKSRRGLIGFATDLDEKEFAQGVLGNLVESNQYMATQVTQNGLRETMEKFLVEGAEGTKELSTVGKALEDSFFKLQGRQGVFDKFVNEKLDEVLAPVLGKNSASELVRKVNRSMFALTLGAGDLGFVALNAITPIQTVLPELSFVTSAVPAQLEKYYTYNLVRNSAGNLRHVGSLEPLKILRETLRDMRRAGGSDDVGKGILEMVNRAKQEGVLDAKLVEEIVGSSSSTVANFKGLLKGETGMLDYLGALSEFLPARSEEFSRGLAFLAGRRVGADFFKLQGEQLFQFASQFTGRTMFLYNAAARPQIITGAAGSFFGLFKNWSMHYIANMTTYASEGLLRGNWSPFMWMMAGTGTVAGVGGLPAYGIANAFSEMATDKTLMENAYQAFGYDEDPNRAVDAMFYGLPAFLGSSLQGRAAVPGAAMMRDVNMLFSISSLERAEWAKDALGASLENWMTTGRHPVDSQGVRDRWYRTFLPRTAHRWLSFTDDNALKSMRTQNKLISDVTLSERLQFALGVAPLEFEKRFEASEILFNDEQEMRTQVRNLGTALAEGILDRNHELTSQIYSRAIADNVPLDRVIRSAQSRVRNQTQDQVTRQFDEYPRLQLERVLLGPSNRR